MEPETLHEEQPNNSVNLVDLSRTLLRIIARLPKSEYGQGRSNGQDRRQAAEGKLDDLPDPASDRDTSRG